MGRVKITQRARSPCWGGEDQPIEDAVMTASPQQPSLMRTPPLLHRRARLFVDESPAGLCSNCLGNVFINFTFLKTHVKKGHSDTQGRLKR